MAKESGLGDNFYVAGYDVSGDISALGNISGRLATLDVTGIDKSARERIGGERDGSMEFTSFFNSSVGQEHDAFSSLPTADVIATYARGTTLGNAAAVINGKQVNYDPSVALDGAFTIGVSIVANGYGVEWGQQLTAGKRTDTTATNGTGVDFAASTSFGFQAYLQVFSFAGTSVTVKLQDSADNATFADITSGAFTAATGRTSQRIAVGGTATVRRYVRVATTGTFTSAVFSVVIVKNATAVTF